MKLIADSGSTKTNWCLLAINGERSYFETDAFNPSFTTAASLATQLPSSVDLGSVRQVFFYGPGSLDAIADRLRACFSEAEVHVAPDFLAGARALLGDQPGFAANLGAGCNTCLFDGQEVI